jgi:phosphate:Na+ symporter
MDLSQFDYWMFIAGLGVFLFGMFHLEQGLKGIAGRSFKKLLQRFSNRTWKGIVTGSAVTAVLQSSSLVMLLVLAFLGSSVITFQNALGIVFGANIGTTFTAWIVATLGFKVSIAGLSLPFLALGTLSYLMLDTRPVLKSWGSFLIGFGLLFMGLDYMKTAIEVISSQVNLEDYAGLGLWVFLIIGTVITILIQSSSATIVIVLSAINAGLIGVEQAAALVIGANIGTTSTLILASFKGSADKKRLATANVIFNFVTGLVCFILLDQIVDLTTYVFGVHEPLMEVVLLNTTFNVLGIMIFYPFIPWFGRMMRKLFASSEPKGVSEFIKKVEPSVVDLALDAMEEEINHLYTRTRTFIEQGLLINDHSRGSSPWTALFRKESNLLKRYEELKQLEDEITDYYTHIQTYNVTDEESDRGEKIMSRVRRMIYAGKDIRDVITDIEQLGTAEEDLPQNLLSDIQKFVEQQLSRLDEAVGNKSANEHLDMVVHESERYYRSTIDELYTKIREKQHTDVPVSTITNTIKKVTKSMSDLAIALKKIESKKATF